MNDNYLWDGSGDPDPEVKRLEMLLGELQLKAGPAPEFALPARPRRPWWTIWLWPRLATAAVLLFFVAGGVWLVTRQPQSLPGRAPVEQPQASWGVARLEGAPSVVTSRGSGRVSVTGRLAVGDVLETDGASRARIDAGGAGEVEVEPGTRLRLVGTRPNEHRLALERGTIHALIWSPPGQFFVETPSAVAVDLGCTYTLKVDETGAGLVRVTFGWVGFETKGRESFIPEGALCATRPGIGPGTPFFEDAPQTLQTALEKLDFETPGPQERKAALDIVLEKARRRDALSLWHLLSRLEGNERARVYDRMAALAPPPAGVTREGILHGDKKMFDLWWDQLGLGNTAWWRIWERQFNQPVTKDQGPRTKD